MLRVEKEAGWGCNSEVRQGLLKRELISHGEDLGF